MASSFDIRMTAHYSPEDHQKVVDGETDPFQSDTYHLEWRPSEQHVLVFADERLVGHVGMVQHSVEVNDVPMPVVGIGGVITHRDYRGGGLAAMALEAARTHAKERMDVPFMMLFCNEARRGWYERQGWSLIPDQVWVDQPHETVLAPLHAMSKPLGGGEWPPGEVRLRSFPW